MRTLVFNGWAAGPEAWRLTTFDRDWTFDYIEQLDGLPVKVIADMDDVVFVGFSMGGSTVMRMMLDFPEKVRGVVFISSTPRMMEVRDAAGKSVWPGLSERRLSALRTGTGFVFRDDPLAVYDPVQMDRGIDFLRRTDLREELRRAAPSFAQVPVRILQSEKDGVVRPHNAKFLQSVFPQAGLVMIPGTEHALPVSVPELVDAAVQEVLAG